MNYYPPRKKYALYIPLKGLAIIVILLALGCVFTLTSTKTHYAEIPE